jgi:tetratricopeptide (TPR) repeat protein
LHEFLNEVTESIVSTEETLEPTQDQLAQTQYQAGKDAFERGQYRQSVQYLEKAVSLSDRGSRLGGEMQIWLVTAYEAAGQQQASIDLCEQVSRHPDYKIRKQGSRLLYILKAPRLKIRPEWLTEIPDLTGLEEGDRDIKGSSQYQTATKRPSRLKPKIPAEPIDLSQVNTQDNRFVWVALGAIILTLAGLFWLS